MGEQKEGSKVEAEDGQLRKQLADYKDSIQRLQAEFENYKKRVEKEKLQFRQVACAELVKGLLPIVDSFELALKAIGGSSDAKLVKGLEMIYAQFYSVLESQGLRPIKAVGEKLDPYRHEVLLQQETSDEKQDGIVAEEFQKGYLFNELVLRFSKVKVYRVSNVGGK